MAANPNRSKRTNELYRYEATRYLGDWLTRPLDAIARKDVETRFNSITADHGWSAANRAMSLPRSVYRRPCVDLDGLRNQVNLWLAGRGKISAPGRGAAVLARRDRGGGPQPGDPGRPLVRALHRHAPRGGAHTPLGADRPRSAHLPGRGDQDRRAPGVSDHESINASAGEPTRGAVHIQTVNSRHSQIKGFLRGRRGIATKYLDSYLRWFHLIELGDQPSPRACLEAAMARPCLRFEN